jgi:hypothetical protein
MNYVTFDPENGDLALKLPEEYLAYVEELYTQLTESFMDQSLDESVLPRMNQFVEEWLRKNAAHA